MDVQMDGWMDGQMDGWMDVQMDGQMMNKWMVNEIRKEVVVNITHFVDELNNHELQNIIELTNLINTASEII